MTPFRDPIPVGLRYSGAYHPLPAAALQVGQVFCLAAPGDRGHIYEVVRQGTGALGTTQIVRMLSTGGVDAFHDWVGREESWRPAGEVYVYTDPLDTYDDDPNGR